MIEIMRALAAVFAVFVLAACSAGGEEIADPPPASTDATSTTVAPATTAAPSTTTSLMTSTSTTEPLPEPSARQRLVVTGEEEVVWDWTTDRCEDAHIPDITARAFRNTDGEVNLTISHWNSYPMVGPSLGDLSTDCGRLQLGSDYDPDPAAFNDSEWIGSVYTDDGQTVYAVIHNEYRGDTHGVARPGQCPSGERLPCLDTSFTMAVSTDGGRTFAHLAEPPGHLIASLPYSYVDDSIPTGIRQPSNIVEGPGGYWYLFGNVSDRPDESQWVCAMRTDDLSDPAAWRYWDGTDFAGKWKNPYLDTVTDDDKCAPLAFDALGGSVQESIVYDEAMGRWLMAGISSGPFGSGPDWGVYTSTSDDLIEWTVREHLLEVPIPPSVADPDNDVYYAYPAIIDPDSESMSFGTSDGGMYLYLSRFNAGGNSLDRDLVRWPIAVEEYEPEAPDWTFDDASDLDDEVGGWSARSDLDPLAVVDGALQFQTLGGDPAMQTGEIVVPTDLDRLTIRLRTPDGLSTQGELFWVTDTDLVLDGEKYTTFEVLGTGEFTDIVIELGEHPEWIGTVRSIRLDPVTIDEPVAAAIDRIWFERSG